MNAQRTQAGNVFSRLARTETGAIGGGKTVCEPHGECRGPSFFDHGAELVLDRFGPATKESLELFFQRRFIRRLCAVANIEHEAQHGEIATLDFEAPVEQASGRVLFEQGLDLQADLRRQHVARQPDEGKEMSSQRRFDQRKARARTVDQCHHRCRNTLCILFAEADQEVVRKGGHRMNQRLAGMAALIEIELVSDRVEPLAQDRNGAGRGGQCSTGPDAGMDRQGNQLLSLASRHDEKVERDVAMDARKVVCLDDQGRATATLAIEPLEGAIETGIDEEVRFACAADAERAFLPAVTQPDDMAELGEHTRIEPFEQRAAFRVVQRRSICFHLLLELRPILDCGADVLKRDLQGLFERAALLGIYARGLDVDHRFPECVLGIAVQNAIER